MSGIENEQWKTTGQCSKCRRSKYCSKYCKRHKERMTGMVHEIIRNKIVENMMKIE